MALWQPGMRITADRLNAIVSDWQDYTPTWYADSGSTTLGNGTLDGRYMTTGKTCHFSIRLEWGSSTTTSVSDAFWEFALPILPTAVKGTTFQPCDAWIFDVAPGVRWAANAYVNASTGRVTAIVVNADGGSIDRSEMPSQTAGSTTSVQPGSGAWSTGDRLNIWGTYETV